MVTVSVLCILVLVFLLVILKSRRKERGEQTLSPVLTPSMDFISEEKSIITLHILLFYGNNIVLELNRSNQEGRYRVTFI